MTKFTLMIEGTASVIAAVLAAAENAGGATVSVSPQPVVTQPPVAVPVAPVTAPTLADPDDGPADANAPAVDSAGLPWDDRIHAKTKVLNADGTWRGRRGVDAGVKATVEAELRARAAAPVPIHPMTIPTVAAAPVPVTPNVAPPVMAPQPVPVPQPVVVPVAAPQPVPAPVLSVPQPDNAPQPVASPAPAGLDVTTFMSHIASRCSAINPATGTPFCDLAYLGALVTEINTACNASLTSIADIASYPQLIDYAAQLVQRDGRW